ELNSHLMPAVAQGAGTDDLAQVRGGRRGGGGAGDFDAAVEADGQGLAEEEGDAAEREVAGGDVKTSPGEGAVEHDQSCLAEQGLAGVAAAVGGGGGDAGQGDGAVERQARGGGGEFRHRDSSCFETLRLRRSPLGDPRWV